MHIHITARHLKMTGAIHSYVADKISHLEHVTDQIMGAHIVLWHDETTTPSKAFTVKVHLAIPGPDIFGESAEPDLYAAVDKVIDKLANQLRKHKSNAVKKKRHDLQRKREREKRFGK